LDMESPADIAPRSPGQLGLLESAPIMQRGNVRRQRSASSPPARTCSDVENPGDERHGTPPPERPDSAILHVIRGRAPWTICTSTTPTAAARRHTTAHSATAPSPMRFIASTMCCARAAVQRSATSHRRPSDAGAGGQQTIGPRGGTLSNQYPGVLGGGVTHPLFFIHPGISGQVIEARGSLRTHEYTHLLRGPARERIIATPTKRQRETPPGLRIGDGRHGARAATAIRLWVV